MSSWSSGEGVGEVNWRMGRVCLESSSGFESGRGGAFLGSVQCSKWNGGAVLRLWRCLRGREELVCARAGSGETLEGERRRGAVRAAAGDDEYQDGVAMGRVGAG